MLRGILEQCKRFLGDPKVAGALAVVGIVVTIIAALGSTVAGVVVAVSALAVLALIVTVGGYLVRDRYAEAYEVLTANHRWEIEDVAGSRARYEKVLDVRFTQNNTIAIWDASWGEGKTKTESCDPGEVVDVFSVGGRRYDVISLREKRGRGDKAKFEIVRLFEDAFTGNNEWIVVETRPSTKKVSLQVAFPRDRSPTRVTVAKGSDPHVKELGPDSFSIVGGRKVLHWEMVRPRSESYVFRWKW